MANSFKSFYLEDIEKIINRVALANMMTPAIVMKMGGEQLTLTELSSHNSLVAMHNEGVREMADRLIEALREDGETDG